MEGALATVSAPGGRAHLWVRWVAIVVLLALLVGGVAYANEDVGMAVGPTCTVGVTGTAASLTVKGWQSQRACDSFDAGGSIALYRFTGQVTTPAICQYRMQGLIFTVNDQGVLKLVGNVLCATLRSRPVPKTQII